MSEHESGYMPQQAMATLVPLAKPLFDAAGPLAAEVYPEHQRAGGQIGLALQAVVSAASAEGMVDGYLIDAIAELVASAVTQTMAPEAAFMNLIETARDMANRLIEAGVVGRPRKMQ